MPKEIVPQLAFDRLFRTASAGPVVSGFNPNQAAVTNALQRDDLSVLDAVREDAEEAGIAEVAERSRCRLRAGLQIEFAGLCALGAAAAGIRRSLDALEVLMASEDVFLILDPVRAFASLSVGNAIEPWAKAAGQRFEHFAPTLHGHAADEMQGVVARR